MLRRKGSSVKVTVVIKDYKTILRINWHWIKRLTTLQAKEMMYGKRHTDKIITLCSGYKKVLTRGPWVAW